MNDFTTDIQVVEAIKAGDPEGIKYLYKQYYSMIAEFILKNNGLKEDAEDIFQETLISMISNIRKSDFNLTSKLSSYMYSISRNMWLYRLRKIKSGPFIIKDSQEGIADDSQIPELELFEDKHRLIAKLFDKISVECQKILSGFYFENKALKDIGVQMNYTEGSIRVKKSRCMDSLKKLVENDPDYIQLIQK
jgi:RNA polymerase sigma factor (sigma-70 family)